MVVGGVGGWIRFTVYAKWERSGCLLFRFARTDVGSLSRATSVVALAWALALQGAGCSSEAGSAVSNVDAGASTDALLRDDQNPQPQSDARSMPPQDDPSSLPPKAYPPSRPSNDDPPSLPPPTS